MPDVVVVGGGIVGAACAFELASRGASVTLLEREELAAGASGRNNGLWLTPTDPTLLPMARASLARYLEIAEGSPVPFRLDETPIGLLAVALDETEMGLGERAHAPYVAAGVDVESLEPSAVLRLEPELSREVLGGWLVHHGHRLAPAALTVALALMAVERGAVVRHHLPARAVIEDAGPSGGRGDGRRTGRRRRGGGGGRTVDAGAPGSDRDPLPITGARGWLVRLDAESRPLQHLVASAGWEEATGRWEDGAVLARTMGDASAATSTLLHPATDGSLIAGSSRQPVLTPEAEDARCRRRSCTARSGCCPRSPTPASVPRGGGSVR